MFYSLSTIDDTSIVNCVVVWIDNKTYMLSSLLGIEIKTLYVNEVNLCVRVAFNTTNMSWVNLTRNIFLIFEYFSVFKRFHGIL